MSETLLEQLQNEPHLFEFYQAVRLLEIATQREPVGNAVTPQDEAVSFRHTTDLRFHSEDIQVIRPHDPTPDQHKSENNQQQFEMQVDGFGLTGSNGILPHHYTATLLQQLKQKNPAMRDYFDLFNHRSLSLLYQAWEKYRFEIGYSRARNSKNKHTLGTQKRNTDPFTQAMASLIGINLASDYHERALPIEALIGYAGLLMKPQLSTVDLSNLLSDYFAMPIQIHGFQGSWINLENQFVSRLPDEQQPDGINNQLGKSVMLGKRCWQVDQRIKLVIHCETPSAFYDFAPHGAAHRDLLAWLEHCVDATIEVAIHLLVDPTFLPPARLGASTSVGNHGDNNPSNCLKRSDTERNNTRLGFNACLSQRIDRPSGLIDIRLPNR